MTNPVLLDNITHKDLRVITRNGEEFGDNVNQVLVFPTEFADVQREYPILFRKDGDSGNYQSVALLGFAPEENLFLDESGWNAGYIPGIVARGPFMIGFQQREVDGELQRDPVIHVDIDNPRVGEGEGEKLFLPHGGNSPYLERVAGILRGIHEGTEMSEAMFTAFESCGLLEPVNIQVEVHRDEQYDLRGFYTLNEEKLAQLDGATLERLNRSGFLQGAFLVISSLNNVRKLIEMKRRMLMAHTSH